MNTTTTTNKTAVPSAPPQAAPVRRVGTITMGVSLVAAGIALLCALFVPNFSLVTIAKLSPLILVLVGIEILVSRLVFKGDRLKYDFLSGFVCLLLILGALGLSFVPTALQYAGPQRTAAEDRLSFALYQRMEEALAATDGIADLDVTVRVGPYGLENETEFLSDSDRGYVTVTLSDAFQDKSAFVLKCRQVMDTILPTGLEQCHITFYSDHYELHLNTLIEKNASTSKLEAAVQEW